MSMLFYLDENNQHILHPEVVKLCPSFRALNEKEMLYVILYTDYNSIYRQFPEHERKRKAMFHSFGDNESELVESGRILKAVDDYTSLQYNPKIEVARSYQTRIDKWAKQLENEDKPSEVKKIADGITSLRSNISDLERESDIVIQKRGVVKGKMELSYLEELMSNERNYNSIINKPVKLK